MFVIISVLGCGKSNEYSPESSAAMFVNAAPGATTIFNVLVDNVNQTTNSILFKANSAYLNILPGPRSVVVQSNNVAFPVNFSNLSNENFTNNTASTFFIYDTLLIQNGTLRTLRLIDNLSNAKDGFIKIRFIPLAPNANVSDVTFLRTSVTPNDSITIPNIAYVGNNPSVSGLETLSKYTEIPGGIYTIKTKNAGTQVVTATATSANLPIVLFGGVYKGTFTYYSNGTAKGFPLAINGFRQYP